MNVLTKKMRAIIVLPLLGVLLTISLLLFASYILQRPSFQKFVIERISDATGYDINTSEIDLSLWRGIGISVYGLEARSREGFEKVIASKVNISLNAGQLLRGRIVPARIYLYKPKIELNVPEELGALREGASPFMLNPLHFWIPGIKSIIVDQGYFGMKDMPFSLHDLNLDAHPKSPGSTTLRLKSAGKIVGKGKSVSFGLEGTLSQKKDEPRIPYAEMALQFDKVPMTWIPWPEAMPFGGFFGARLNMNGSLGGPISVGGQVFIDAFYAIPPKSKHATDFNVSGMSLDFQSIIKGHKINIPSMKLKTPDFSLALAVMIDLKEKNNPYLDLEVASEFIALEPIKKYFPFPIFPSWVEHQLFSSLKSGFVRLNLLSLKGKMDQVRNLSLPQNQSVLTMHVECKNFRAIGLGFKQPFKDTTADLILENGTLLISGLRARFGQSTIRDGSLSIKRVFSHSPSYEVSLGGSFELPDVIQQLDMDFVPQTIRRKLSLMPSVSGNLLCQTKIQYERGWEFPRFTSGEFLIRDCSVDSGSLLLPLVLKGIDIRSDKKDRYRLKGFGSWGKTPFKITGDFALTEGGFDLGSAAIAAKADMKQILSIFSPGDNSPLTFDRALPLNVVLERKKKGWSMKGKADLEGIVLETNDFYIDPPGKQDNVAFELDLGPQGKVDLKKCRFNFGGSALSVAGIDGAINGDTIALRISPSSFSLKDLGFRFKKGADPFQGEVNGDLEVRVSRSRPSDIRLFGSLNGKNLLFRTDRLSAPVKKCDFKMDFSGQKIDIDFWKMTTGKSRINIRGHVTGWETLKGDLTVSSPSLDLSDFLIPDSVPQVGEKEKARPHAHHKRDFHVNLDIKKGIWEKLTWGPLRATLDLKDEDIYIRKSDARLEHGILNFKGHWRKKQKPALLFSTHIKLNEQPIEELFSGFGIKEYPIRGKLTLDAYLFTRGEERKDLIPNLTGSGAVLLNQGSIKNPGPLIKVLEFMSLQNIYKKKPPELTEKGFYVEGIDGNVVISKGILKTENLILKSPALKVAASGELDMTRWVVDGKLVAQPIESIDNLVNNIPILGYILAGEDKSILTYYFNVKGPAADPKVEYVPFKTLGSGVASLLKRLILTPIRMLQDLSEAAKKPPEFNENNLPGPEGPP